MTLNRPLVDYVSAGSEPKLTDVAKCTVTRAKPKAEISWIYDSPSKNSSNTSYQPFNKAHTTLLYIPDGPYRLYDIFTYAIVYIRCIFYIMNCQRYNDTV